MKKGYKIKEVNLKKLENYLKKTDKEKIVKPKQNVQ